MRDVQGLMENGWWKFCFRFLCDVSRWSMVVTVLERKIFPVVNYGIYGFKSLVGWGGGVKNLSKTKKASEDALIIQYKNIRLVARFSFINYDISSF